MTDETANTIEDFDSYTFEKAANNMIKREPR